MCNVRVDRESMYMNCVCRYVSMYFHCVCQYVSVCASVFLFHVSMSARAAYIRVKKKITYNMDGTAQYVLHQKRLKKVVTM